VGAGVAETTGAEVVAEEEEDLDALTIL
jgi:hypothetical protein